MPRVYELLESFCKMIIWDLIQNTDPMWGNDKVAKAEHNSYMSEVAAEDTERFHTPLRVSNNVEDDRTDVGAQESHHSCVE